MSYNGDRIVGVGNEEKRDEPKRTPKCFAEEVLCSDRCLLLLGLTAIALDPLFFYIPMMKNMSTCLGLDKPLLIVVVIFRTVVDVLHDCSWWCKSLCVPNPVMIVVVTFRAVVNVLHDCSRCCKSLDDAIRKWYTCMGRLQNFGGWIKNFNITDPKARSRVSSRVIAVLASLPFPQVVVYAFGLQSGLSAWLMFGVPAQLIPRFLRVYPTYHAVATNCSMYEWICGAVNLLLFLIAGHALGGLWYLRALHRKMDHMAKACQGHWQCTTALYCESGYHADNGFMNDTHVVQPRSNTTAPSESAYGIYSDTVMSNVIESTNIISKVTYGFWWGISNLCSMAQNLELGNYIWDTLFAVLISILGLFLSSLLIGNLQMYMQSSNPRKQKKQNRKLTREKEKREAWQIWFSVSPFLIPKDLRNEVSSELYWWEEVDEINLETFLNNAPLDLRKRLTPFFCEKLFNKMENFMKLEEKIKKALRERARPMVFRARTNIHEEGSPFHDMIHIVQGKVLVYKKNDVEKGLPIKELDGGDFFGEELLQKALESPLPILPMATQNIQSVTKVEAFVLSFHDFGIVFTKYGRLIEPYKQLWAANVIQCAYRRYVFRTKVYIISNSQSNR